MVIPFDMLFNMVPNDYTIVLTQHSELLAVIPWHHSTWQKIF